MKNLYTFFPSSFGCHATQARQLFRTAFWVVALWCCGGITLLQAQITTVNSQTNQVAGTSITINKPVGLQVGDLMMVNLNIRKTVTDPTVPSGWTKITSYLLATADRWIYIGYKVATAADVAASNFTFVNSTTSGPADPFIAGAITAFRNVNTTTNGGIEVVGTSWVRSDGDAGTTITPPSITTLSANSLVVFFGQIQATSTSFTNNGWRLGGAAGTLMNQLYIVNPDATNLCGIGAAALTQATAGASGSGYETVSAQIRRGGILIALKAINLSLSTSVTNATCATSANGAIDLTVTGGTAPFTYAWSNGATTQDLSGLTPGTYSVTVTDANNATANTSAVVSFNNTSATITGAVSPVSTPGGSDGAIDISLTGFTAPVTYAWSNSATTQDVFNLAASVYTVTVTESNGCVGSKSFTVLEGLVNKQLYLSDPSQALDRVDPVATADGTTAQSGVLSLTSSTTTTITTTKATFNYQDQNTRNYGNDEVIQLESDNGFLERAFVEFDLASIPAGATITSAQLRLVHSNTAACDNSTEGGDPITIGVRKVTRSWVEGTTCNANQAGSLTWSSAGATNWTTAGGDFAATNYGTFTGARADADGALYTVNVLNLVNEWYGTPSSNFGLALVTLDDTGGDDWFSIWSDDAPNAANRPQLIVTYTLPGTTTTSFTQAPALCAPLTIEAGSPITLTNYVTITSGSMPSNPNITAVLKYGATTIATLSNPTYNSGAGTLAWTTTLGSDVTVPAGQAIVLEITTAQSGVAFTIDYDSQTKPSKIDLLPVSTFINVNSQVVYDAAFPGGSVVTSSPPGSTVYVRTVVSDPFGFADITGLRLRILTPGGGISTVTATSVATSGCTRTYEYAWTIPAGIGNYSLTSIAREGSENSVIDILSTNFSSCPTALTATVAKTNVLCKGANNGTITVSNPTGSAGPWQVSINGTNWFAVTAITPYTFSGLAPNTYNVRLRDVNFTSCALSLGNYTVTEPANALTGSVSSQTNVFCFGTNTGAVTITASGGTSPYQYRIDGGTYGASNSFSGLAAGAHTVTVRDANLCTFTVNLTITQLAVLTVTPTLTQPNCSEFGSITLSTAGGAAPYTYDWADVAGTSNPKDRSGLTAGTYSVTVTDANGCTVSSGTLTLSPPSNCSPIKVCLNDPITTFSVDPNPLNTSYTWTVPAGATIVSGQGTHSIVVNWSGVAPGSYQVCVSASNQCGTSAQLCQDVDVFAPPAPVASANPVCTGGTIQLFVTGGTMNYNWSGPNGFTSSSSNPVILNASAALHNGTYNVTVTNSAGCSAATSVVVTVSSPPQLSTSITQPLCGQANGIIDLTVTAGTPTFTYTWSNGATTQDLSALLSGVFFVTVTDAVGCTATTFAALSDAPSPTLAETHTNVACFGGNNGSINLTPTNFAAPLTFLWSNSATTEDISGLSAGNYAVTVQDANGCRASLGVTITQPSAILLDNTKINVNCFGAATGSIDLLVSGGTSPYSYTWTRNGNAYGGNTQDLTGLTAGTYAVTVTDANSCTALLSIVIAQPAAALSVVANVTNLSCFGNASGQIILTASGGTAPYTYDWADVAGANNSKDRSGLAAGSYSVTVTDSKGCTFSLTNISLTQPAVLAVASAVPTNVSCFGGDNGRIDATISGGTPGYMYLWSNGSTVQNPTSLVAGTYVLTVTDSKGCTAVSSNITVGQPAAALVATPAATNVSCFELSNGSITLTLSGGTSPYTYLWSNNATTQNLTDIPAGTYTVTVTDANMCMTSASATLTEPTALVLSGAVTNVLCNGAATGVIDLSVSGGTSPYTYVWNGGATTQDRSGLTAGTYSVTVTDANNCTSTSSFTLTEPNALSLSKIQTNISCFGGNDGSIDLSVSGGIAPYTYLWSNAATTEDISGLMAGTYTVTVTDANNCSVVMASSPILQPAEPLVVVLLIQDVTCKNGNDGSATASTSGGTGAYTYQWSNGATVQTPTNFSAGTYTVTVADANGCTAASSPLTIEEPATMMMLFAATTPTSACGGNTGTIDLSIQNGTAPFSYVWTGPTAIGNVQDPTGLAAGAYSVVVTDALGCTASLTVTITTAAPLTVSVDVLNPTCLGNNGEAYAIVAGGTAPYTYVWSPGGATTASLSGLSAGTYMVTVTDANNCTATASGTLTNPPCAPPVAVDDNYCTQSGVPVNGTVATNDSDPDNLLADLTFLPLGFPTLAQGTITWDDSYNGAFTFTPAPGFVGVVTIPYQVCDPTNLCDQGVLTITVQDAPVLSVGSVECVNGTTYQYTFAVSPGAIVVSQNGTISGNKVTLAVGTNDVLTAYRAVGCASVALNVTSPANCNITCQQPTLTLGNSICNGATYSVSFTETTGATITTAPGNYTITGNVISGIPVGTNVVITATNPDDAACAITLTAISPDDCNVSCPEELISVSALGICSPDGLTYSVNFVLAPGATLTRDPAVGTIGTNVITGIPVGTNIRLIATNAGCNKTDDIVVTAPNCCLAAPVLSVGSVLCVNGTTYQYTFAASPGAIVVSQNGTISGNTVTVAVGTNDVLTAYRAVGCPSVVLNVTSPANCNITCQQPTLTLGNSICNGATYSVSFTETTGATITTAPGNYTITGNVISGIPVGTNVVITATNPDDAACAITLTAISPDDCNTSCPDELISVSALGICSPDGLTYSVNFVLAPGATLTRDPAVGTIGTNVITGIPVGTNIRLIATNAGCNKTDDIVVTAPNCCPAAPVLSVGSVLCVNGTTYQYTFAASPGAIVVSQNGTISGNTVTVAVGTNDVLTAYRAVGCPSVVLNVTSPANCNITCQQPTLTLGNSICNGATYSVSFTETTGATITTAPGNYTITGNVISGIPVGTNVVITATNPDDAACAITLTAISPDDCNTSCPDELISVSALGICSPDGLTYSVNFVLAPGATLTRDPAVGTIGTNVITGIPVGTNIRLIATNAGCNKTDDIVVTAPNCCPAAPVLSVGSIACVNGTTYRYTFAASPGSIVVSQNGTISGNTVTVAVGTNDVLTAYRAVGCPSVVLNVTSPVNCNITCKQPTLTLGNSICNGATYSVSFTETTGATITTAPGNYTITGNVISGIPVGTNAVITATNPNDGNCMVKLTVISPDDCNTSCPDELISVSALGICSVNGQTYSVNFVLAPGATLTRDPAVGTIGTNVITGIPAGTNIRLIATNAGCNKTDDIVVVAPNCCVTIEAYVYLEGSLIEPQTGQYQTPMRNTLNTSRFLPGQFSENPFEGDVYTPKLGASGEAYNIAPWNYQGTEGDGYDSQGLSTQADANYPSDVVDWVLVSLRDSPDENAQVLCRRAGLLFRDGHIEFVSNADCCNLNVSASYYLVIEHRNHLIVMSHTAIPVVNGRLTYDFRIQQSYLNDPFGSGDIIAQKEVLPGVFAMYAGNGDQSTVPSEQTDITASDFAKWVLNGPQIRTYNLVDYNLDGEVSALDFDLWQANSPRFTSVPRKN